MRRRPLTESPCEGASAVTVIVPTFEVSTQKLGRCISAIIGQTYPGPVEVIVVDNGLNRSLVVQRHEGERATETGPRIVRVLHEPAPGAYAARNAGVLAASGRWIAFTDADCEPDKNWLSAATKPLIARACSIAAGAIQPRIPNRPTASAELDRLIHLQQELYVQRGYAATANMVVDRDLFETFGLFDAGIFSGADAVWGSRATSAGAVVKLVEDAVVVHDTRDSLSELVLRYRRSAGGLFMSLRFSSGRPQRSVPQFRTLLSAEYAYAAERLRLLNRRLNAVDRPRPYRAHLYLVWGLLHVVRCLEHVRLAFRENPERR